MQWYIDICLQHGVDESNTPWLDDLYLDVVVSPSLEVELLDADELGQAWEAGEISKAEFDLAWREADKLMTQIARRRLKLLELGETHRQWLLQTARIE